MMVITQDKTIKEVQEEFNLNYPFLRIEFLNEPIVEKSPVDQLYSMQISEKDIIGQYAAGLSSKELIILPEETIAEVEKKFSDIFNIKILILCQSGNTWVKAMKANYWSLAYQNEHAERLNGKIGNFD